MFQLRAASIEPDMLVRSRAEQGRLSVRVSQEGAP